MLDGLCISDHEKAFASSRDGHTDAVVNRAISQDSPLVAANHREDHNVVLLTLVIIDGGNTDPLEPQLLKSL